MRILSAVVDRAIASRSMSARPMQRAVLVLTMAAAVAGTAACARTQPEQPQARLGAASGKDGPQWNGNGKRQAYGSKDLGPMGLGNAQGGGNGAGGRSDPGDTVLFQSDSSDLTPESKAQLDGMVAQMRSKTIRALAIEGHADERGTREYNLALGARRAAAVKSYLLSKGMLESQVRTISFGKERPVATCDDISCWAKNRRAQVIVADR